MKYCIFGYKFLCIFTRYILLLLLISYGSVREVNACRDSSNSCIKIFNANQCSNPVYKGICCKTCTQGPTETRASENANTETCTDVTDRCSVVVKLDACSNYYYRKHCCKSCVDAGKIRAPTKPAAPASVPPKPTPPSTASAAFNPIPDCGQRIATHSFLQPGTTAIFSEREIFDNKIFGGKKAEPHSWPWMALLGRFEDGVYNWVCGGSYIREGWILTAAHCFERLDIVRLGEHDTEEIDPKKTEREFKIDFAIWYPEYQSAFNHHDIGLVKFSYTEGSLPRRYIRPVCLPWGSEFKQDHVGKKVTVTGWGAGQHLGAMSTVLRQVSIDIFNVRRCRDSYYNLSKVGFRRQWPDDMTVNNTLCAGDEQAEGDSCQGDSGGPLMFGDHEKFTILGVVSSGFGCGQKGFPGIYTPVYYEPYLKWIRQQVFKDFE